MVPKFRAWDKKTKEYFHISELWNSGTNPECFNFDGWMDNFGNKGRLKDIVIEQYTGLKDANGKEIYENDIIKYFGANKRAKIKTTYGIVFYDSEHGCFNSRIQNEEHNKGGISPLNDLIIGNVYNNPELLEEKK